MQYEQIEQEQVRKDKQIGDKQYLTSVKSIQRLDVDEQELFNLRLAQTRKNYFNQDIVISENTGKMHELSIRECVNIKKKLKAKEQVVQMMEKNQKRGNKLQYFQKQRNQKNKTPEKDIQNHINNLIGNENWFDIEKKNKLEQQITNAIKRYRQSQSHPESKQKFPPPKHLQYLHSQTDLSFLPYQMQLKLVKYIKSQKKQLLNQCLDSNTIFNSLHSPISNSSLSKIQISLSEKQICSPSSERHISTPKQIRYSTQRHISQSSSTQVGQISYRSSSTGFISSSSSSSLKTLRKIANNKIQKQKSLSSKEGNMNTSFGNETQSQENKNSLINGKNQRNTIASHSKLEEIPNTCKSIKQINYQNQFNNIVEEPILEKKIKYTDSCHLQQDFQNKEQNQQILINHFLKEKNNQSKQIVVLGQQYKIVPFNNQQQLGQNQQKQDKNSNVLEEDWIKQEKQMCLSKKEQIQIDQKDAEKTMTSKNEYNQMNSQQQTIIDNQLYSTRIHNIQQKILQENQQSNYGKESLYIHRASPKYVPYQKQLEYFQGELRGYRMVNQQFGQRQQQIMRLHSTTATQILMDRTPVKIIKQSCNQSNQESKKHSQSQTLLKINSKDLSTTPNYIQSNINPISQKHKYLISQSSKI